MLQNIRGRRTDLVEALGPEVMNGGWFYVSGTVAQASELIRE
jgi:hypothetical protein